MRQSKKQAEDENEGEQQRQRRSVAGVFLFLFRFYHVERPVRSAQVNCTSTTTLLGETLELASGTLCKQQEVIAAEQEGQPVEDSEAARSNSFVKYCKKKIADSPQQSQTTQQ